MDTESYAERKCENAGKRTSYESTETQDQVTTETRDWSDASTNKGRPRVASNHQKLERRKEVSP